MPDVTSSRDAIRSFFCGVGGLGTLLTANVLGEAAVRDGLDVVTAEVHGASQRGGSVHSSVVIGAAHSPLVPDGRADFLVSLEPLEALRYQKKIGPGTTVICNAERVVPVTVTMGGTPYPPLDDIRGALEEMSGRVVWFNATEIAREAGLEKAANAALLGALCSIDGFPVSAETLLETLRDAVPARYYDANAAIFHAGARAAGDCVAETPSMRSASN